MNRLAMVWGSAGVLAAIALAFESDAAACGGCFHPPTQTVSDITDERMLLSVSPMQSTLYDQIRYSGSPSSFAWVLPIHGTVTVGLSADVLFDSIDALTETQITPPPQNCPSPSNCFFFGPSAAAGGASSAAEDAGGVSVLKQENVGPYATVQLHATDSSALSAWLAQNGFNIAADVKPVIDEYVLEGFDFLAMKLLPNQGVQAMRPVRVTTPGASLSLPLRMAAIGTGATVGITIWVVADGRYEPQNFLFYHIDDSQLVWDWSTSASNYTTLRVQNEADSHNAAWEMESSLTLNEVLITNVILSGGQYYGRTFGGGVATGTPSDPSLDYLPVDGSDAGTDGGAQTAEEVRTADVNALFAGMAGPSVRVTRMRSDIAHSAMTKDFVLRASADQSEMSNIRNVTQSVNLVCPIYNGCNIVGSGTYAQAAASVGDASTGGSTASSSGPSTSSSSTIGSSVSSSSSGTRSVSSASVSSAPGALDAGSSGAAGGASRSGASSTGSSSGSDQGGCIASGESGGSDASWGVLAGMMGLVVTRIVRSRRRSS